jgi:hypothetical protein
MPLTVLSLLFTSIVVYLICERALIPDKLGIPTNLYLIATSLLFGCSYVATILTGPGYLPFYFPYANPNTDARYSDALSGMVTTNEQEFYLRNVALPHRTAFFRTARRVVIRPDHFCASTACFIGKKNQKLFFLLNFWGMLYVSGFAVASLRTALALSGDSDVALQFAVAVLSLILAAVFAILAAAFTFGLIYEISANLTAADGGENDCVGNWEEVFGPRAEWYLWAVPVPAFSERNDRLLLAQGRAVERHPAL